MEIKTLETDVGRVYVINGIPYPSVTTVISGGGKSSGFSSPAATIGTLVHKKILSNYSTRTLPVEILPVWKLDQREVHQRINLAVAMWRRLALNITPIMVESVVYSNDDRYAGRLDMTCELDGVYTVLDIKTGREYDYHPMQGAAYWYALDEEPDQVAFVYLDSIIDRNPSMEGHVRLYNRGELTDALGAFRKRLSTFHSKHDLSAVVI